jgi:hypothetical protein
MKYFLVAVIMSVIVFTIGIFSAHAEDVGAYTKARTDDTEVASAANFAMVAIQKELRKKNKDALVSLVEIMKASKQVVAGVNYKILLKVNINLENQVVEAVVWKKLSDDYELTSWKQIPAKKKDSGDSR